MHLRQSKVGAHLSKCHRVCPQIRVEQKEKEKEKETEKEESEEEKEKNKFCCFAMCLLKGRGKKKEGYLARHIRDLQLPGCHKPSMRVSISGQGKPNASMMGMQPSRTASHSQRHG
ncbi:hypothetical protein EYF80_037552 [Liparis tanakae]|uniref:Uncharacterized protein n=1 Tax=Liparis tanakae TaxID=230148 RepID=A0A4Z2GFD6_9TELE|nr:hypothetical protein EYF80_037552 [Liparis tanakae]